MKHERIYLTGASSGIGRALALEFARREPRTFVLTARRVDLLESLAAELEGLGSTAHVERLDVVDVDAVRTSVRAWHERVGGLDLVIANAGVGEAASVLSQSWDDLQVVLDVNARGAIATLFAAIEPMVERGRGTLVGISSLAALRGVPRSGTYAASKAALTTWLETIRADLARTPIEVVDVRPGFVLTAMTENAKHAKPFEISVEDAARRTVDGIERQKAVVSYAAPMKWLLWGVHRMPDWLWRLIGPRIQGSGTTAEDRRSSRQDRS